MTSGAFLKISKATLVYDPKPAAYKGRPRLAPDECWAVRPVTKWLGMEFEIKPLRKACRTLKKDRHLRKAIPRLGCPIGREFGRVVAGHRSGLRRCLRGAKISILLVRGPRQSSRFRCLLSNHYRNGQIVRIMDALFLAIAFFFGLLAQQVGLLRQFEARHA